MYFVEGKDVEKWAGQEMSVTPGAVGGRGSGGRRRCILDVSVYLSNSSLFLIFSIVVIYNVLIFILKCADWWKIH